MDSPTTPRGDTLRRGFQVLDPRPRQQVSHPVRAGGCWSKHQSPRNPCSSPNANAVCERFLGSVRRECLDPLFFLGPRQLLHVLKAYVDYCVHHRPHQGLQQRIPEPLPASPLHGVDPGTIQRISILRGLHHTYSPAA
ncbi:MAG: transposase [Anaerolinea sp.]|nr:transposase [Anaerolinea sp.]